MTSKRTKAEVDKWESMTHVFVSFNGGITLEGTFIADELSEIAGIQRRRLKEQRPPPKLDMKGGMFR